MKRLLIIFYIILLFSSCARHHDDKFVYGSILADCVEGGICDVCVPVCNSCREGVLVYSPTGLYAHMGIQMVSFDEFIESLYAAITENKPIPLTDQLWDLLSPSMVDINDRAYQDYRDDGLYSLIDELKAQGIRAFDPKRLVQIEYILWQHQMVIRRDDETGEYVIFNGLENIIIPW